MPKVEIGGSQGQALLPPPPEAYLAVSEDIFVLLSSVMLPNILQCTGLAYSSNPAQNISSA